jgi:hypothetical protein
LATWNRIADWLKRLHALRGLSGIEVSAVRRSEFRGRVTLMADYGSRGSTDDLGQFRLFNV